MLVLTGSKNHWVAGMGYGWGTFPPSATFPPVGGRFDVAPGRLLETLHQSKTPDTSDNHQHGVGGYSWAVSNHEPGFLSDIQRWSSFIDAAWLVLDVAERDYVLAHGRSIGKCRCARGKVAYSGTLEGAIDFMRPRWPMSAGPPPAWEEDPYLFPPPKPEPKPARGFRTNPRTGWQEPIWG